MNGISFAACKAIFLISLGNVYYYQDSIFRLIIRSLIFREFSVKIGYMAFGSFFGTFIGGCVYHLFFKVAEVKDRTQKNLYD